MSISLKEETVLNQWSTIVAQGARHSDDLLEEIQGQLKMAQIPGGCTWSVEEVKSSTWVARVRREFLIVRLEHIERVILADHARRLERLEDALAIPKA